MLAWKHSYTVLYAKEAVMLLSRALKGSHSLLTSHMRALGTKIYPTRHSNAFFQLKLCPVLARQMLCQRICLVGSEKFAANCYRYKEYCVL